MPISIGSQAWNTSPDLVQAVLAIADTPDKPISAPASAIMRHVLPYAAAAAIALVIGLSGALAPS